LIFNCTLVRLVWWRS